MNSMVTIINNTVLPIWKLLREYKILKVLITRKKISNYAWWQMLTYWGDHFAVNKYLVIILYTWN